MNKGELQEWGISLRRNAMRGKWKEGFFMGTPKDMLSKAVEMGVYFHWGRTF